MADAALGLGQAIDVLFVQPHAMAQGQPLVHQAKAIDVLQRRAVAASLELIERKAAGEEIAVQPEAPQPKKVPDLMAALEASLAAVKGESSGNGKSESRSSSGGKKSSGGSRKKAASKR